MPRRTGPGHWERLYQLGKQAGRPMIKSTAIRQFLSTHKTYEQALLHELSDEAILHALQRWKATVPKWRKAETLVPALVEWAEDFNWGPPSLETPAPVSGCTWCDEGYIVETAAEDVMTSKGPVDYEMLHRCPECNGGSWLNPKPAKANHGEYRRGWYGPGWEQK